MPVFKKGKSQIKNPILPQDTEKEKLNSEKEVNNKDHIGN